MDEKRAAPERRPRVQKRKRPLKQRIAIAIVRAVEGREQKKNIAQPNGGAQPRRRVTPEQRRAQVRRMRRRRQAVRVTLAVLVVGILFLILSWTVLFKIQNIEITNPEDANYTSEQIISKSGIAYGTQNLFRCNLDKVARNIEQSLPYIGKATVKRDFPSSLRITVQPTKAAAAVAYGAGYLLIDADGKMLENTDVVPDKVPVLRCNTEFEMNLGQVIGVPVAGKKADDKDKAAAETIALFKRINEGAQSAGLQDVTLIDIRDVRAITLMYQNRLTLHLGTEDALETKLQTAAKTIAAEDDGSKTRTGAIDLTTVPYAFARDTYEPASNAEEETLTEENTTEAA